MFAHFLLPTVGDEKSEKKASPVSAKEVNAVSDIEMGAAVSPSGVSGKLVAPVVSPGMTTALELRNPSNLNPKISPSTLQQTCAVLPSEAWLQVWCAMLLLLSSFSDIFSHF